MKDKLMVPRYTGGAMIVAFLFRLCYRSNLAVTYQDGFSGFIL
jgi:hypothetical protein